MTDIHDAVTLAQFYRDPEVKAIMQEEKKLRVAIRALTGEKRQAVLSEWQHLMRKRMEIFDRYFPPKVIH